MKKTRNLPANLLVLVAMILIIATGCNKEDDPEIVSDIDGNEYNTVKIGGQVWMKENLKTTKLNDGTAFPLVTGYTEWFSLTTPGYCWYDNNEATFKDDYGAMYNWYAVETGKLCPSGWHVPTDGDWQQLVLFIDPDAGNGFGESAMTGGKLKEKGTAHWLSPNQGASDNYGFSALPGGFRLSYLDLDYNSIREYGAWWSSTPYSDTKAWIVDMGYDYDKIYRYASFKTPGFSVRCIKD